jgi:hypothetical protein
LCHQQQATTDRIASNFVSHVKQLWATEFSLLV